MSEQNRLDAQAIRELRDVMEDEFEILMTTFIKDSQVRIADLVGAHRNWSTLCRIAHAFKGSSSNVGAVALADCCRELEDYCREWAESEENSLSAAELPDDFNVIAAAKAEQLIDAVRAEHERTVKAIESEILFSS